MTPTNTNLSQTHGWLPRKIYTRREKKERLLNQKKTVNIYIYMRERGSLNLACFFLPKQ